MNNITVYTKNNCVQCKMTKKILLSMGLDFKEINISQYPEFVEGLKAEGFRQTPVVKIDGMEPFSGFRPDLLKKAAAQAA
ncbi:glutaredoxin-like protein NrdH [Oenococcus alcoholitolerans]|uniref:Glutaredoxin-like protein NrdH n=1 Tax=Oenococcus alcoholitolerans TaxID=931074 RepID=A0ABR4XSI5_9LACO|nr:glutaredoxin [Oenococcus alcoholitolerans]